MIFHNNTIRAYAKINLGLNILKKRDDGFHEIETIFQQVDLFDEIQIQLTDGPIEVVTEHPEVPAGKANIGYQAAKLLKDEFNIRQGVRLRIQKNIPVGAGLGGGSSDAAAILKYLNQKWDINLDRSNLAQLSTRIGSDVPFFIYGGTMLATGRGEILVAVEIPIDYKILLIFPNFSVSTKWAYKNFKINLTNTEKNIKLANIVFKNILLDDLRSCLHNNLETVVFEQYQQLKEIKDKLYQLGARYASMSGSGSAVYGLFPRVYEFPENVYSVFNSDYQIFLVNPLRRGLN